MSGLRLGAMALGLVLWGHGPLVGAKPMLQVTLDAFQFQPDQLTVAVGQPVVFVNKDGTPHTVSPVLPGQFDKIDRLLTNERKTITFKRKGTYAYYCELHTTMTGRIIVR